MSVVCQIVLGHSNSGKSTYCAEMSDIFTQQGLKAYVINLDPTATELEYTPHADVRDLLNFEDIRKDMSYSEGITACMNILVDHPEWFEAHLTDIEGPAIVFLDSPSEILQSFALPSVASMMKMRDPMCYTFLIDSRTIFDELDVVSAYLDVVRLSKELSIGGLILLSRMDELDDKQKKFLEKNISVASMLANIKSRKMVSTEYFDYFNELLQKKGFEAVEYSPMFPLNFAEFDCQLIIAEAIKEFLGISDIIYEGDTLEESLKFCT